MSQYRISQHVLTNTCIAIDPGQTCPKHTLGHLGISQHVPIVHRVQCTSGYPSLSSLTAIDPGLTCP